jgi:hypothetical protein
MGRFLAGDHAPSLLVVGASGMGKTSVLASAFRLLDGRPNVQRIWIGGSVVASEGQFFRSFAGEAGLPVPFHRDWRDAADAVFETLRISMEETHSSFALFVDDFDLLAFKRESLVEALAAQHARLPRLVVLASAARGAVDRILGHRRPFAKRLRLLSLSLLSHREAQQLVQIRAPTLPLPLVHFIVRQAGGHPAALVFLSRLAELFVRAGNQDDTDGIIQRGAELAGSVYAEAWSGLGPQQRAILWHVSTAPEATQSVTQLSHSLCLLPSHVSAQLTRLRDEGLVVRRQVRGQYRVPPLLARWILERAVRHQDHQQRFAGSESAELRGAS